MKLSRQAGMVDSPDVGQVGLALPIRADLNAPLTARRTECSDCARTDDTEFNKPKLAELADCPVLFGTGGNRGNGVCGSVVSFPFCQGESGVWRRRANHEIHERHESCPPRWRRFGSE